MRRASYCQSLGQRDSRGLKAIKGRLLPSLLSHGRIPRRYVKVANLGARTGCPRLSKGRLLVAVEACSVAWEFRVISFWPCVTGTLPCRHGRQGSAQSL